VFHTLLVVIFIIGTSTTTTTITTITTTKKKNNNSATTTTTTNFNGVMLLKLTTTNLTQVSDLVVCHIVAASGKNITYSIWLPFCIVMQKMSKVEVVSK
jgi:hypothetical protein